MVLRRCVCAILLAFILVGAGGCAGGTCADYANDIWGPPPGCSCLENAYGCGPFDYPTGYGYARQNARSIAATGRTVSLTLTKVRSSCPALLRKVSSSFTIRRTNKRQSLYSPSFGAIALSSTSPRLKARITRAIPMLHGCQVSLTLQGSALPAVGRSASVTVNGSVECAAPSYSCSFEYRGTLKSS